MEEKEESADTAPVGSIGARPDSLVPPLLAGIYVLGVSAVSRWILICFKEASPVLPPLPSPPPLSLSFSHSLSLLPISSVRLLRGVSVRSDALGVQTCKDPDGPQSEGLR